MQDALGLLINSDEVRGEMVYRILILEDEILIADVMEDMVRELGYEVSGSAHTRTAALEAIDRNDFDIALVDMSMDGKDFPEVPDRLMELDRPFAFVSGYHRAREARHAHIEILLKPFRPEDLKKVLASLSEAAATKPQ